MTDITSTSVTLKWTRFDTGQLSNPENFKHYWINVTGPNTNEYFVHKDRIEVKLLGLTPNFNYTFYIYAQSEAENPAKKQIVTSYSNSSDPVTAQTLHEGNIFT